MARLSPDEFSDASGDRRVRRLGSVDRADASRRRARRSARPAQGAAAVAVGADLRDDRKNLPNAVALNSLQFNLSRAIGPLLAGLTLAAWGSVSCFILNALS